MDAEGDRIQGINWRIIMGQGGMVTVRIPALELDFDEVKVHGYDQGGLWIESQKLTDLVCRVTGQSSLPTTPVFFVPYSAIHFAFVALGGLSLSSENLGL